MGSEAAGRRPSPGVVEAVREALATHGVFTVEGWGASCFKSPTVAFPCEASA